MARINKIVVSVIGLMTVTFIACNPESPGLEYMPDMYRSPAIEPYVDNAEYGNTEVMSVRQPVEGTIPRGFMPFDYENTIEDYERAGKELKNPLPSNEANLERGKELYGMMCKHCHGAKGDGKGSITNAVYGAVPSYKDKTPNRRGERAMADLKAGHIYHTIMYGLNAMGPHDHITNETERWMIVQYVQSLQGKKMTDNAISEEEVAEEVTEEVETEAENAE